MSCIDGGMVKSNLVISLVPYQNDILNQMLQVFFKAGLNFGMLTKWQSFFQQAADLN